MWSATPARVADFVDVPACWCGGHLVKLWKGRGNVQEHNHSRGLLIRGHAKYSSQCVVPCVASSVFDVLFESQNVRIGVRSKEPADLRITSLLPSSSAEERKRPGVILSLGVTKAFDTVLRESCLWCHKDEAEERKSKVGSAQLTSDLEDVVL